MARQEEQVYKGESRPPEELPGLLLQQTGPVPCAMQQGFSSLRLFDVSLARSRGQRQRSSCGEAEAECTDLWFNHFKF